jgi:hypothetical protein
MYVRLYPATGLDPVKCRAILEKSAKELNPAHIYYAQLNWYRTCVYNTTTLGHILLASGAMQMQTGDTLIPGH